MELERQLQEVQGQLAALTLAVRALLITHPARAEAVSRFHAEYEQAFARVLPRAYPDGFVSGLQRVRETFFGS